MTIRQKSAALNRDIDSDSELLSRTYVDPLGVDPLARHPRVTLRDVTSRRPSVSGLPPHRNRILAGLPLEDYQRLLPHLEPITLRPGLLVARGGAPENDLYFPTEGIVSRYSVTRDGATTELAVTGKEGVIGVASFLGGDAMLGEAVALTTGHAYRLGNDMVRSEFGRDRALAKVLLRYTQVLMAHIGQIAICNRHHSLEQQLCRWILSSKYRLASSELRVTHETIARMLGVRREGVTRAATKLRNAGMIDYSRGRISIINVQLLEEGACECNAVINEAYERLHHSSGTAANAGCHRTIDPARCLSRNRSPHMLPLRTIETL